MSLVSLHKVRPDCCRLVKRHLMQRCSLHFSPHVYTRVVSYLQLLASVSRFDSCHDASSIEDLSLRVPHHTPCPLTRISRLQAEPHNTAPEKIYRLTLDSCFNGLVRCSCWRRGPSSCSCCYLALHISIKHHDGDKVFERNSILVSRSVFLELIDQVLQLWSILMAETNSGEMQSEHTKPFNVLSHYHCGQKLCQKLFE